MPLVVPNVAETDILTYVFTSAMTLRLYGNNINPGPTDTAATYTEIAGGGYANLPLILANWVLTAGAPSYGLYPQQTWLFTGAISAPSTIYGYYVTRNSDGKLMWAERFPVSVCPFTPIAGSQVRITPKFTGSSVY